MTVYLTKIMIKFLYLSSNVTFEYISFTKDPEKNTHLFLCNTELVHLCLTLK